MERVSAVVLAVLLVAGLSLAARSAARLPEDPRDVPREAQLTSTSAKADLDGDGRRESLLLVNALTGEQQKERASEVVIGVYTADEPGELLWVRHVMRETGKPAHDGEVAAIDLDGDGASEIIVSWDTSLARDRIERRAEIWSLGDASAPRKVWEGSWERDTRRDPETSESARELYRREIDYGATRRAAGKALIFRNVHRMIAGKPLDPARVVTERVNVSLRFAGSSSSS